jgi:hypothetical protein
MLAETPGSAVMIQRLCLVLLDEIYFTQVSVRNQTKPSFTPPGSRRLPALIPREPIARPAIKPLKGLVKNKCSIPLEPPQKH